MKVKKNNNIKNNNVKNNNIKKNNNVKRTSNIKKTTKKRKIKYGRVILVLLIIFLLFNIFKSLLDSPIKNIYISGNEYLSDQEIIELASLQNYPSIFKTTSMEIKKKLEKNDYIKTVKITKKKFKEVYINIEENYPLFYNQTDNKTILSNKKVIDKKIQAPVLLNYIPDTKYDKFLEKMDEIDYDILKRTSEITYQPNNVDDERFLFTMNDGNYVYLTLEKFTSINHYVSIYADIIKKYGNKKGILNLDAGDYFSQF